MTQLQEEAKKEFKNLIKEKEEVKKNINTYEIHIATEEHKNHACNYESLLTKAKTDLDFLRKKYVLAVQLLKKILPEKEMVQLMTEHIKK